MQKAEVTIPLDIPEVRVLQTELTKQGEIIITVESTKPGTTCRWCGQWLTKSHGYDDWVQIRHLPVFGHPTFLRYRPKRYQCDGCEKRPTTTQRLDWHEKGSPHTVVYDEHLLLQLVNATVEDISRKEQVRYDCVLGVLERQVSAEPPWSRYRAIPMIGLDEIALKKGHRDFVTIVTGRLANQRLVLLAVLPDRKKDTVIAFLRSLPMRLVQTIARVCCDMYEGFTEAVREELPQAHLVIDRFHVTQHYAKAADQLRQHELKRLKKTLPEAEYQTLKGNMWAFRKKKADLQAEERQVLHKVFAHAPALKRAYQFREQLTALFEQPLSQTQAQHKFRQWSARVQKSGLTCFDPFIKTLETWLQEITNYFLHRDTSGFVEGFNNKIKVLKRRAYGIFNLKHLFQRLYLDLEGYRLFTP